MPQLFTSPPPKAGFVQKIHLELAPACGWAQSTWISRSPSRY